MLLFSPLIMIVGWMVHVHYIKFPFHLVLGAPILIFDISSNLIPLFLDYPGFNIVNPLSITLVGVPVFSVGLDLGYVTSSSLNCCKDRSFFL